MSSPESTVDHYLGEFRAGRCAEAFHGLIESGPAVVSDLITAYEGATDLDCEVFVIEVISEFRLDSSLGFLRHALGRDDPRIWKAALRVPGYCGHGTHKLQTSRHEDDHQERGHRPHRQAL